MMEGSILKALYLRVDFSQQVPKGTLLELRGGGGGLVSGVSGNLGGR
jgi:hypothetical protein